MGAKQSAQINPMDFNANNNREALRRIALARFNRIACRFLIKQSVVISIPKNQTSAKKETFRASSFNGKHEFYNSVAPSHFLRPEDDPPSVWEVLGAKSEQ